MKCGSGHRWIEEQVTEKGSRQRKIMWGRAQVSAMAANHMFQAVFREVAKTEEDGHTV